MIDLSSLQQQLQQTDMPPVESWQPPFCGDIAIHIDAEGRWYYQHSLIQRDALVKLFASVLLYQDQQYFLQTPVEKVRISVADAPLLITDWHTQPTDSGRALLLSTNLQHQLVLGKHSGRSAIVAIYAELGIQLESGEIAQLRRALAQFSEQHKCSPQAAELRQLLQQVRQLPPARTASLSDQPSTEVAA